jgi:hypothetical protein
MPIVAMTLYRGFIVIATASGVYTIKEPHEVGLDNHVVEKVVFK